MSEWGERKLREWGYRAGPQLAGGVTVFTHEDRRDPAYLNTANPLRTRDDDIVSFKIQKLLPDDYEDSGESEEAT